MTTTATKQTITTQTPQPEQPRASLALASDPSKALRLSPTFQPDVDLLTAEGLIAFGVKGSGKSNLLALLVEQLGRFLLPQLIIRCFPTGCSPARAGVPAALTSSTRACR